MHFENSMPVRVEVMIEVLMDVVEGAGGHGGGGDDRKKHLSLLSLISVSFIACNFGDKMMSLSILLDFGSTVVMSFVGIMLC